jgi:enamine deaminase RidA (YjgF/YER057c/UK114 family)
MSEHGRVEHLDPEGLPRIKWNIFVVQDQPLQPAFEVFQRVWGRRPSPPLITVAMVSGLAQPDYLAELEAVAVVPA